MRTSYQSGAEGKAFTSALGEATVQRASEARAGWIEAAVMALYAIALASVTLRHEMFRDEMQAFLIARDSNSLSELFHNLRYEGHPALWHLILYIPAHLSWNPASMQWINFVFAVIEAWLIVSARRMQMWVRVLCVFSFFVFYGYGVVARNYMLAMLLLTAAVRCFYAVRERRGQAIGLLALAIQTHFFAIPVVAVIAIWKFAVEKIDGWRNAGRLLRDREFWIALVVLMASLAGAYFTIRPPADIYIQRNRQVTLTAAQYFVVAEGRLWQMFVPIPEAYIPKSQQQLLVPAHQISPVASALSLALLVVIVLALRTRKARIFFAAVTTLELVAFAFTVHVPAIRYYGLIFASLIIALMIDAYDASSRVERPWVSKRGAAVVMGLLLGVQVMATLAASATDWVRPYSEAKEASEWLKQNGLDKNPMVVEPSYIAPALIGYLERPMVYYPACHCMASFTLWSTSWDVERVVTSEELNALSGSGHEPVIVVTNEEFDAQTMSALQVKEIQALNHMPMYGNERMFIYEKVADGVSEEKQ